MHTWYVLLSHEPKGKRKLMCSEEDLTVICDPLLCGDSLYLKAKTETAPKISFSVGTQPEENPFCTKTPAWKGD